MIRLVLAAALVLTAAPARADKLVIVAGGDGPDGAAAGTAKLVQPFGVEFAADGTMYVVEMAKGERLRAVTPKGDLVTLAGAAGEKGSGGDGGPGLKARFNGMHHLAVGPDGCVYLADTFNNRVRKYDPKTGAVSAFAGTGEKGFAGDGGPAVAAKFGGCYCLSFDRAGKSLTVTDLDNKRIRRVDLASNVVSTVAGNGKGGVPKDGAAATTQPLVDPRAHAVDTKGNLYILERGGHALRVVDAAGTVRTVAGTGKPGAAGLGGKALAAQLNGPKHLCVDSDGSVLIADTENHRVVRYVPGDETLLPVCGSGKKGAAGVGGDPRAAELAQPHGVTVHPKTRELYVADSGNGRVLRIVRE